MNYGRIHGAESNNSGSEPESRQVPAAQRGLEVVGVGVAAYCWRCASRARSIFTGTFIAIVLLFTKVGVVVMLDVR
jgi:hypothetical protein